MNGIRVYVAGPYTVPDPEANTLAAIDAADRLFRMGYAPFVPHLSHYWDQRHRHEYSDWLEYCLQWVPQCQAVLRLHGESSGADIEVELAHGIDIPVFHSVESLHLSFLEAS